MMGWAGLEYLVQAQRLWILLHVNTPGQESDSISSGV